LRIIAFSAGPGRHHGAPHRRELASHRQPSSSRTARGAARSAPKCRQGDADVNAGDGDIGPLAISPALYSKLAYDPVPISAIANWALRQTLVAGPSAGFKT